MGRGKRYVKAVACMMFGLLLCMGVAAHAAPHTVVIKGVPVGPIPPRPAILDETLAMGDSCGDDDGSGWFYVCTLNDYQAWMKFDLSSIPDGVAIQSMSLTALMYSSAEGTQRTLWYDSVDSWTSATCPEDKVLTELVGTLNDPSTTPAWQTFDLDLTGHDWSNDLADNTVTLMMTGPLSGEHEHGYVALDEAGEPPSLAITYDDAVPTLGEWGVIALFLVLMGTAAFALHRRRSLI